MRAGFGQVDDLVDRHEPFQLCMDLVDHRRRAIGYDRDPADSVVLRNVGHSQAVDVITARSEQPGDLRQYASFIVNGDGQDVPLCLGSCNLHHTSAFASSSIVPATWSP